MKTRHLDKDKPAMVPEIVAQTITQNPFILEYLCARARRHWRTSPAFRKSFQGKDEREVLTMWLIHWSENPPCDSVVSL